MIIISLLANAILMYVSIKKCPKVLLKSKKKIKGLMITIKIAIGSRKFLLFFFHFIKSVFSKNMDL